MKKLLALAFVATSLTAWSGAPTAGDLWRQQSPAEKVAQVRGIIEGSQVSVDSFERYLKPTMMGLTADPAWISDPVHRGAYGARASWGRQEGLKKGLQRSRFGGKPEAVAALLDKFYVEPRNARVTPANAVWLVNTGAFKDDERKWAHDKVQAHRAAANVRWLTETKQRDKGRPTLAWDRTVGTGPFGTAKRADGATETYYSLDPYYAAAMFRVEDEVKSERLRLTWHIAKWHDLNYRPMTEAYRRTFRRMFANQDKVTGLLVTRLHKLTERELGEKKPKRAHDLSDATWGAEFALALRDDPEIVKACLAYLDAVWRSHWVAGKGFYGVVDLDTGARLAPGVKINFYGYFGTALAEVYALTKNAKWRDRVQEINQWVWSRRRNPARAYVPLFLDAENPEFSYNVEAQVSAKEAGWSDDSDSIYYIRDVFEQWKLTGMPLLKEIVSRHGRDYIEAAWLGDAIGHFTRHWWVDVQPLSQRMYGDGRFNSNYQMAHAAALAATAQEKRFFLDYLDKQLATFQKLDGVAGLFGQQFLDGGKVVPEYGYGMDDWGLSQSQEQYCSIYLAAYEAGGERKYLDAAKAQMDRMLAAGPQYWNPRNASFPPTAVRLANALGRPARAEISLGAKDSELRLLRDGAEVFKAKVPAEVAVIYLPPGDYTAEITAGGATRREAVRAAKPGN
ncbi:MAG: hypothetical protein HZA91_07285 [Verrucomicrobia bacterium]|nr:hypothetical protein [Verrucomicrobiota bacterium]